jgi:flagellar motor component MotA
MFAIIGMLVVIGAVAGGYLLEHGQLLVLMQPAELVIIGGAALGSDRQSAFHSVSDSEGSSRNPEGRNL